MKKCILLCLVMFYYGVGYSQDVQAIKKVLAKQSSAWNNGDIEGFMKGYWQSDSLLFVGKSGSNYGWQTTLDHYKKGYPDKAAMGQLSFDIKKVDVLDKTNAFVFGGWHIKREKGDLGGCFTLWLKKIKGEWVIVCDHTS